MLHDILKDFPGSQNGSVTEQFKAGTRVELSESLAAVVVREGWAKPAAARVEAQGKAPAAEGGEPQSPFMRRKK